MTNELELMPVGVFDSTQMPGGVGFFVRGVGRMTMTKNEAWRLYLAMQSYFSGQPRNRRTGNTCPGCGKGIDDRAKACRNCRRFTKKKKGENDAETGAGKRGGT